LGEEHTSGSRLGEVDFGKLYACGVVVAGEKEIELGHFSRFKSLRVYELMGLRVYELMGLRVYELMGLRVYEFTGLWVDLGLGCR
jgi:hypothetical protein